MKKPINYEKVVDQFRQRYPDIYFYIKDYDPDMRFAFAQPLRRIVTIIPADLVGIVKTEEDLIFVLLHEVGHCETFEKGTYERIGGKTQLEVLADQYACLNGSTKREGVKVLSRLQGVSKNKAHLAFRIEQLKQFKKRPKYEKLS